MAENLSKLLGLSAMALVPIIASACSPSPKPIIEIIQKGNLVSQLDTFTLQLQLEQIKRQLQEATFNKNDFLALGGGRFGGGLPLTNEGLSLEGPSAQTTAKEFVVLLM